MIQHTHANGTVVIDFAATEKIARTKTSEALRYAIQDCRKALEANPDGVKAGYYADEIHIYGYELRARLA